MLQFDYQTGLWSQDEFLALHMGSITTVIEVNKSQHFKLHRVNGKKQFPAWLTRRNQSRLVSQLRLIFEFPYVPEAQTIELCYILILLSEFQQY